MPILSTKPPAGRFNASPPVSPTPAEFNRAGQQLEGLVGSARTQLNAHNAAILTKTQPYGAVRPTFQELQCQRMNAELSGRLPRGGPDCLTGAPVYGPTPYDP